MMAAFLNPFLLPVLCLGLVGACGVKSAPTPLLDSPPSELNLEKDNRAAEKKAREKQKEKQKP
ncbi:MAG: hypothetical protein RLZZ488_614 [Pseudomonadota bacterium]|jgi:hypothetical protein